MSPMRDRIQSRATREVSLSSFDVVLQWLDRPMPCSRGHFSLLNPETSFFSYCFNSLLESGVSLLALIPLWVSIQKLAGAPRYSLTFRGQIAYLLAVFSFILRLSTFYLDGTSPTSFEWLTLGVSGLAAALEYLQDGRVAVCGAELLLYWLLMLFTTFSHGVDDYLRGRSSVYPAALNFIVTATILSIETARSPSKLAGYDSVNLFDIITMGFLTPLLKKGQKTQLERDDLPAAPKDLNPVSSYEKLSRALSPNLHQKLRVLRALIKTLRWKLISIAAIDVFGEILTYARPLILSLFLKSITGFINGEVPIYYALYFAILLGAIPIVLSAAMNLYHLLSTMIFIQSRPALNEIINRKSLTIHPKAREEYNSAKIMNLISVDSNQIDNLSDEIPILVSAPTAIILAVAQLYFFLGPVMLVALPVYLVFTLYTSYASRKMFPLWPEMMAIRDERIKATSDAIKNIKSLKLYAWEVPFSRKILEIRNRELRVMKKVLCFDAIVRSFSTSTSDIVGAAIFVAFLYFKRGTLSADIVFPCLAILADITDPFTSLPDAITSLAQAFASQGRINDFLIQPDMDYKNYSRCQKECGHDEPAVEVKDATVSWNGDEEENRIPLRDISFEAGRGDLICITGKVGSGKSALLKSLCGETVILDGKVSINGSLSYCSQEPWLQNTTVKENVTFGQTWDAQLYGRVIEACALRVDIDQFPNGDDTQVGERGVSLSGGQKTRVALARAVYACSDIFILDDILSAVDEHVSSHLIQNLLGKDGLLASKTIILATNNVKVLSHASRVITLQDKVIAEHFTVQEFIAMKEKSLTYNLIKEFHVGGNIDDIEIPDRKDHILKSDNDSTLKHRPALNESISITLDTDEDEDRYVPPLTLFSRYFEGGGRYAFKLTMVSIIASVLLMSAIPIWLGIITTHNFTNLHDARVYIGIYVIATALTGLSMFLASFWFLCTVAISISQHLHEQMLKSVLRGPMSFFDTTSLGKILNRFTQDFEHMDYYIPPVIYLVLKYSLGFVVQMATVIVGAPLVIFIVVPLGFMCNQYKNLYIPGTRQLQRMTSAANSPILSHIEESVKGAPTIRSFDRSNQFVSIYEYYVDAWVLVNFSNMTVLRWLAWRVQLMTSILDLSAALTLVALVYYGYASAGLAGVVMFNSNKARLLVRMMITMWADLEVDCVSLDRVIEYVDLETEGNNIVEATPSIEWPQDGQIQFRDFSTRYSQSADDVLKKLSFIVNSNEKVGVIGRTGSGKSTLTLSLFRLLEASSGNIKIDSFNTSQLGLSNLRSQLSIIPQDSQIFGGTLRENLDPFASQSDEKLWQVLSLCSLKDHFEELGTGLETELTDGGGNLSRGQTQLICLARALLRESKILVLDEATASVDVQTDKIVQKTIREKFKDCTIITIAHRLNTISDSDRILVLDAGEIAEYDTPAKLLESKGHYYSLTNSQSSH